MIDKDYVCRKIRKMMHEGYNVTSAILALSMTMGCSERQLWRLWRGCDCD